MCCSCSNCCSKRWRSGGRCHKVYQHPYHQHPALRSRPQIIPETDNSRSHHIQICRRQLRAPPCDAVLLRRNLTTDTNAIAPDFFFRGCHSKVTTDGTENRQIGTHHVLYAAKVTRLLKFQGFQPILLWSKSFLLAFFLLKGANHHLEYCSFFFTHALVHRKFARPPCSRACA